MTIHRNASRTNNHLGYTDGTYLQYLKSDSNLIRCRKKCTEWTWVLKFQCASESPAGLAKSEAPRGPSTEIQEWGPQIYVFHKNHWSLLQVKLLKDINLSQETQFPPSPLVLLPFSCSPKTALIKATITPVFPSLWSVLIRSCMTQRQSLTQLSTLSPLKHVLRLAQRALLSWYPLPFLFILSKFPLLTLLF